VADKRDPGPFFRLELSKWQASATTVFVGARDSQLFEVLLGDFPNLRTLEFYGDGVLRPDVGLPDSTTLVLIDGSDFDVKGLQRVLCTLRDQLAGRLICWSESLPMTEMLALGFRRLDAVEGLYVFDLFDYKLRPDWFNAEHFAHPQRWNNFD